MGRETRQTAAKQSARECHERPMSLRQRPKSGLGANMYAKEVSPDGYGLRLFGERLGQPAAGAFEGTIQPTVPQGVSPLPCALDGTG